MKYVIIHKINSLVVTRDGYGVFSVDDPWIFDSKGIAVRESNYEESVITMEEFDELKLIHGVIST